MISLLNTFELHASARNAMTTSSRLKEKNKPFIEGFQARFSRETREVWFYFPPFPVGCFPSPMLKSVEIWPLQPSILGMFL